MALPTLTPKQHQWLELVSTHHSIDAVCEKLNIARDRYYEYLDAMRAKDYVLSPEAAEDALGDVQLAKMHPQDSSRNPWPAQARLARAPLPEDQTLVVRSVLLPRRDGLTWPAALPDEKAIVIDVEANGALVTSSAFAASRRERWSVLDTLARLQSGPLGYSALSGSTRLTLIIAWALGVDAVLFTPTAAA